MGISKATQEPLPKVKRIQKVPDGHKRDRGWKQ